MTFFGGSGSGSGAQGPQGIPGTKGDKGDKGDTGLQGQQGSQGIPGVKGDKGDTGLQGTQGVQGNPGTDGSQGIQGNPGVQGQQGIQGNPGTPGANTVKVTSNNTSLNTVSTVNFDPGFTIAYTSGIPTIHYNGAAPIADTNFQTFFNPVNYGAVGDGRDDFTALFNCVKDASASFAKAVYLPFLFYTSSGLSIPSGDFQIPYIVSVDTSTNLFTFNLSHNFYDGDPIMVQGAYPTGMFSGHVYYIGQTGNTANSVVGALYNSPANARAGGSTGMVNITVGTTTTGSITGGTSSLTVSAELNDQLGTNVIVAGTSGASGGLFITGGVGTGTLTLNTTAKATESGVTVTYVAWIDWRFFKDGFHFVAAPGAGLAKHFNWNTIAASALLNLSIGSGLQFNQMTFVGLSNMFVPDGILATTTNGSNLITLNDPNSDWARPGMTITISGASADTSTAPNGFIVVRSASGVNLVACDNIIGTVTNSPVGQQITSGVYGHTASGTSGQNTVTMSRINGIPNGTSGRFDGITGIYTIASTAGLVLTLGGGPTSDGKLSGTITNALFIPTSITAGDDGLRVGSCHNVLTQHCSFLHCGDTAFRVQTNVADYSATQPNGDINAGVNAGQVVFFKNFIFNCYQTSTTTNDYVHGGGRDLWWMNNTFDHLRGSVKFAARVPGSKNLFLLNNVITRSDNHGFELDTYSNIHIIGNELKDVMNQGIFMLPNNGGRNVAALGTTTASSSSVAVTSAQFKVGNQGNFTGLDGSGNLYQQAYTVLTVPDGSHITISPTPTASVTSGKFSIYGAGEVGFSFDGLYIQGNTFDNVGYGNGGLACVRIDIDKWDDGFLFDYNNITFQDNVIKNISNTSHIGFNVVSGSLSNVDISRNIFHNYQGLNHVKMLLRSSTVAGFNNAISVRQNKFSMNSSNGTSSNVAVWIQGTEGVNMINEVAIEDNFFGGSNFRILTLSSVNNVSFQRNRTAGNFNGTWYLTNGSGSVSNMTWANNNLDTTGTFGASLTAITGLYIHDNVHKLTSGANATTLSIANSCTNVWYYNNLEINTNSSFTATPNFKQVPVATKAPPSVLRQQEGTTTPTTGTYTQGSIVDITNLTLGGTISRYYCSVSGTAGSPSGSPLCTTDGVTNVVTFSPSLVDIANGCWINIVGVTGARQVGALNFANNTGTLSGAVPALVTSAAVVYNAPTWVRGAELPAGWTAMGDANQTASVTDKVISLTASLTAARAVTLPLAANVPPGYRLVIQDASGSPTQSLAIQVARSGSDLINGASTTRNAIQTPYGREEYVSDGVSSWTVPNLGITASSTFSNADYAALSTDRQILQTGTLSAARTVTLPLAASVPRGTQLVISDDSGTCTAVNTIIIARQASDGIHGLASIYISVPWGSRVLESNGANKWTILSAALPTSVTKTGAYVATVSDNVILADGTGGAFHVTLPTAVNRNGATLTVKKIDSSANVITIDTTSSQTIDGVTTKVISTQYQSYTVVSDNANWWIA